MELHFQTEGRGDPLIILHGLLGSLDNWRTVSGQLAGHCQVVAVDLRNHGLSPHSPEMDYALMAEDLGELLDRLGFARVGLLGHSMGGKVAMEFALSHPGRVERIIVADIAPRAYPPHHGPIFEALLAVDLAAASTRQQVEAALAPSLLDRALRQFLLKGLTRRPDGVLAWKFNLGAIRDHYEKLCAALPEGRLCPAPALFLRGGASDYVRDEDIDPIHRAFPQARFRTLPSAGHWLHVEAAGEFIQLVLEELQAAATPRLDAKP